MGPRIGSWSYSGLGVWKICRGRRICSRFEALLRWGSGGNCGFFGDRAVTARFTKTSLLTLYCCCHQAERSLDNALSSPETWDHFLAFFDEVKQSRIREMVDMLKKADSDLTGVPSRESFLANPLLVVASSAVFLIVNRLKKSWSFSAKQTTFFAASLDRLLGLLKNRQPPRREAVIDLRMDFCQCGLIIKHKLIGVAEMRLAEKIEHFNQSAFVNHVSFQDVAIHGPQKTQDFQRI